MGKRQAEMIEDQPPGAHSILNTSSANAELAFSDQFRQRKKAKRIHKAVQHGEGKTRPMTNSSAQGIADQQCKGRSSEEPSGLVKHRKRLQNTAQGQPQDEPKMEVKSSRSERPKD